MRMPTHLAERALAHGSQEVEVPEIDGTVEVDFLRAREERVRWSACLNPKHPQEASGRLHAPLACNTARPWLLDLVDCPRPSRGRGLRVVGWASG